MLTSPQGNEFPALFHPFDLVPRRSVIAAVSGGSDSTALLLLLKDHLDRHAPNTRPVAVTIDHALRAGSAREADDVRRLCDMIGMEHLTLAWTRDKPATGLSAAARKARHELLAQAARARMTDLVLLGHTADDQAETVLMRMERDEGNRNARGLAGIAPATLFDGDTWFVRPLIGTRREALRAFLRCGGVDWIDDPTNADTRFERSRMRKSLADADHAVAAALGLAADAARRREELGREAASLIEAHADRPVPGLVRLAPEFVRTGHRDATVYALRILLAVAGGTPHLPDEERTAELYGGLLSGRPLRTALSRTLVDCRKGGIFLLRELRDLPSGPQETGIWDGRYRIIKAGGTPLHDHPAEQRILSGDAPESLLRLAAAGRPVLARNEEAVPILASWARYLPSFDIEAARASARLVGAGKIPDPPFRGHD